MAIATSDMGLWPCVEICIFNLEEIMKGLQKVVWNPIEDAPKDKVVIAGIDSYDCGWVFDPVWWSEDDDCWYLSGTCGELIKAHLPYTHFFVPTDNI